MGEFSGETNQLQQIQSALERATLAVTGEVGRDPLLVFPDPAQAERRADVKWDPALSSEQEQEFRLAMAEVGPGRPTDIGPAEMGWGFRDYAAVLEGGQPHKMVAQLRVIRRGGLATLPTAIYQTASADREAAPNEREFTAQHLGCDISEVATTELGIAEQILRHELDFEPWPEGNTEMPTQKLYDEVEGSLMEPYFMGNFLNPNPTEPRDTTPVNVFLVGVKRVYNQPDPNKYSQASNADKVKQVITLLPSYKRVVGLVTSGTYQPSNVVTANQVAEETGADVRVLSYGTETLAEVKGTDPVQPDPNQLGGEAFKTAKLLAKQPDSGE